MNRNDVKRSRPNKGLVDPKSIKEYRVYVETTLMEFLLFKMKDSSRNTVKKLLSNHQVSVGGVPVSQFDYPLVPEDIVIVSKNRIHKKQQQNLPLLYEDDDIIAIDKPSGLLSIASDKEKGKTAYRLVSDYVASKDKKARVYVVHRLDEDTSGVLIFAKSYRVREALQNSGQEIVEKRGYYAIVEGEIKPKEATLKDYLISDNLNLMRITKNKAQGKLAITHYKEICTKNGYSLLNVDISSGRKNQIRVQLGHIGHHVIGDDKYGEPSNPLHRLGLHAYQLTFTNPLNQKRYDLKADMPKEFKSLMFGDKKRGNDKPEAKKTSSRLTRSQTKIAKANSSFKHFRKKGGRH